MAKALDKPSLYETDYVAWLEEQVPHLRAGRLAALEVGPMRKAVYLDAVQGAAIEETAFPQTLPYSIEEIFERALPAAELPDQRSTRKKP